MLSLVSHMLAGSLVTVAILIIVADRWFARILRTEHPETWQSLGSPSIGKIDWKQQLVYSRFFWRGDYHKCGSDKLDVLGGILKSAFCSAGILLLLLGILQHV